MDIKIGDKLEITVVVQAIHIFASGTQYAVTPTSNLDSPWAAVNIKVEDILRHTAHNAHNTESRSIPYFPLDKEKKL